MSPWANFWKNRKYDTGSSNCDNRLDCNNVPKKESSRLRFDSNTETADCWTRLAYGPMESTYQHDYKAPVLVASEVVKKGLPPPSTVFWNQSMSYEPMESTYQHDFKRPATMLSLTPRINIPMPVLSAYWNCHSAGISTSGPFESTYQADYKKPLISIAMAKAEGMFWDPVTATFVPMKSTFEAAELEETTRRSA